MIFPKENKCHLRFRIEKLLPQDISDDVNPRVLFDFSDNSEEEKKNRYNIFLKIL